MKSNPNMDDNLEDQENDTHLLLNIEQPIIVIQNNNNENNNNIINNNCTNSPFSFKFIFSLIIGVLIFLEILQTCFIRKRVIQYYDNGNKKFEGFTKMGLYDGQLKNIMKRERLYMMVISKKVKKMEKEKATTKMEL